MISTLEEALERIKELEETNKQLLSELLQTEKLWWAKKT